jgi:hypothetical protein
MVRALDDRPVDSLRRRLGEFEVRLRILRGTLESSETSRESVEGAIAFAEAEWSRVKDDASAAHARVSAQAKAVAASDSGELSEGDGEMGKLRSKAETAEAVAAWSLIVATRAICEVELATLKALAVRMELESRSSEDGTQEEEIQW